MKRSQKNDVTIKDMVIMLCNNKVFCIMLNTIYLLVFVFLLYNLYISNDYKKKMFLILFCFVCEVKLIVESIKSTDKRIVRRNRLIYVILKDYYAVLYPLILLGIEICNIIFLVMTKLMVRNITITFIIVCIFCYFSVLGILIVISSKITKKVNKYSNNKIIE